jgi:1,2-diacylglycerol 3-beta-galactosyltransferase
MELLAPLPPSAPRIDFIFFDAGGGHRAAANALKQSVERMGYPWQIRLVDLQATFDRLDVIRRVTGVRMQDVYNTILRRGWTLGSEWMIPPLHLLIRANYAAMVRHLTRFWETDTPDLVVSVVPNFNRVLHHAYRNVRPNGQLVTILTDLADYPPHFWIEKQDQWLVCGTEKAVQQAEEAGYARDRVLRASGMILNPRFYETSTVDRAQERIRLGLKPDVLTGLVLFGGFGSMRMLDIARAISKAGLPAQLIFICGKNQRLQTLLKRESFGMPVFVEGFTSEVPYYMRLADFFIGKPGPGSISEAVHMNLPVIVERNAWTLPQERYNTEWVAEKQVGVVVENFDDIAEAVRSSPWDRLRANTAALNNRAVFEIPLMIDKILGCA